MNIPPEIANQFARGDGALFVGAGLSLGAGLPGWAALIRPLAEAVGYRLPAEDALITADHLLTAAGHYANQRGLNALIRYLNDKLDTRRPPTAVHRILAALPVNAIFTTNYDDLIERALSEAGKRRIVIVSETELAFWSEDSVQVVKLCGSLDRPQSLVITKSQFNTYAAEHPRLAERLRTTLESKTALFLGYSLQDPFFNQIWDNIGLNFGDLRRFGYAVLFDADPLETDDLKRRGIQVVNLQTQGRDRTALLAEWLEALKASVEGKGPSASSAVGASADTGPGAVSVGGAVKRAGPTMGADSQITVGSGDVVGGDKLTAGGDIFQAGAGATLVVTLPSEAAQPPAAGTTLLEPQLSLKLFDAQRSTFTETLTLRARRREIDEFFPQRLKFGLRLENAPNSGVAKNLKIRIAAYAETLSPARAFQFSTEGLETNKMWRLDPRKNDGQSPALFEFRGGESTLCYPGDHEDWPDFWLEMVAGGTGRIRFEYRVWWEGATGPKEGVVFIDVVSPDDA
jgi:hypothetical protein